MTGVILPDGHHVARYCRPKQTADGWPSIRAFNLRPADQGGLSVNWLEMFTGGRAVFETIDRELIIAEVRKVIQMDPARTGLFAVLNIGLMIEAMAAAGVHDPYVEHTPTGWKDAQNGRPAMPPDPSHASAYAYDVDVAVQLLALVTLGDVFPGRV